MSNLRDFSESFFEKYLVSDKPEAIVPFLEYPLKFARQGDVAKANTYLRDIHQVMNNADFSLGPFKTMVKSGEIFMT